MRLPRYLLFFIFLNPLHSLPKLDSKSPIADKIEKVAEETEFEGESSTETAKPPSVTELIARIDKFVTNLTGFTMQDMATKCKDLLEEIAPNLEQTARRIVKAAGEEMLTATKNSVRECRKFVIRTVLPVVAGSGVLFGFAAKCGNSIPDMLNRCCKKPEEA